MIELTFSKSGWDDIVLTEDDLFDFRFERGCFSGDTFELGGVSAKSIYMIIDNNTQRFPRGAFANSRVRLDIDGHFCGYFNAELPKRRNGVIELTAYDDMIKLDTEFPEEVQFPQTFISVYAYCLLEAGIADYFSINGDFFELNALFNNGVISHEYTDYIYANSCRNVVSGMAEWNGGFAYINDDGKLQVDVFSKEVSRTFYSGELMDFDYSDETVVFSKIKTSQKNKTYEMGDDSGYTLIINNQYIGYGLDDEDFEMYLGFIYDYYKDFSLTPMSFTLAEPDFSLKTGDRISVIDEEENVTVTGNISEISVSGNCSMTVTCGGFGNVSGVVNYNKSSTGLNNQTKAGAGSGGTTVYYANNSKGVKVGEASAVLLQIQFSAKATAAPIFGAAIQLDLTSGGTVEFILNYDNVHLITYSQLYMAGAANKSITIPLLGTGSGSHVLQLCLKSADAAGMAAAGASYGWVMGSDLAENNAWDGTITARQPGAVFSVLPLDITLAPVLDSLTYSAPAHPIGIIQRQSGALFDVSPDSITLNSITEALPSIPIYGENDGDSVVVITFQNPVFVRDFAAILSCFTVSAEVGSVVEALSVSSVEQENQSEIRLNVPSLSKVTGQVVVTYISAGGLISSFDSAVTADFIIKFTPDFVQTYLEGE